MVAVSDTKRLFFGLEVEAPWPEHLPSGRILDPIHRHLTLAFLLQDINSWRSIC